MTTAVQSLTQATRPPLLPGASHAIATANAAGQSSSTSDFQNLMNASVADSENDESPDSKGRMDQGTGTPNGVGAIYLLTGAAAAEPEVKTTDADVSRDAAEGRETGAETKADQSSPQTPAQTTTSQESPQMAAPQTPLYTVSQATVLAPPQTAAQATTASQAPSGTEATTQVFSQADASPTTVPQASPRAAAQAPASRTSPGTAAPTTAQVSTAQSSLSQRSNQTAPQTTPAQTESPAEPQATSEAAAQTAALTAGTTNGTADGPLDGASDGASGGASGNDGGARAQTSPAIPAMTLLAQVEGQAGVSSAGPTTPAPINNNDAVRTVPGWRDAGRKTPTGPSQTVQPSDPSFQQQQQLAPVEPVDSSDDSTTDSSRKTTAVADRVEWNALPEDARTENENSGTGGSSEPVAFEAKVSPMAAAADSSENAAPQPLNSVPAPVKEAAVAETQDPDRGETDVKTDALAKLDTAVAQISTSAGPGDSRKNVLPAQQPTVASQMEPVIEAGQNPQSRHSISLNLPGAADDAANLNLRFVERGGDIHVTVRTADAGLAQDLRSGLNDLAGRLEHAGFRTEVANPLTGESNARKDGEQSSTNQGNQGRQDAESQREQQNSRRPARSRWIEQVEESDNQVLQEQNV